MTLGNQQQEALNLILDFIESDEIAFTLSGYAGTGKSYLTKILLDKLDSLGYGYQLCAPTHRAKTILQTFAGKEAITIHKLLSLSPNIQIMDLDLRDLRFILGKDLSMFPIRSIIICDEASMVNDYLFDTLIAKCKELKSKIIFIGDVAQIKPVNGDGVSKVFEVSNKFFLTQIYRQDKEHPLTELIFSARSKIIPSFTDLESDYGNLKCYTKAPEFFKPIISCFKEAIDSKNILKTKLLSYTNKRVEIFNSKIQEAIFGLEREYCKGQFLTAYDNFKHGYYQFYNSMDYIIVEEPQDIYITIPYIGSFPGYRLTVYDQGSDYNLDIFVLSKNNTSETFNYIAKCIEEFRLAAIELKYTNKRGSNLMWKKYFAALESFASPIDLYYENRLIRTKSIDYGYAVTLHKVQGGSIENVFIDMKSISLCRDLDEKRQLQYVGLSRTTKNIYILQ